MINIYHKDLSRFANEHKKSVMEFLERPKQKSRLVNIKSWIDTIFGKHYSLENILIALPSEMELLKSIYELNRNKRSLISDIKYIAKNLYSNFSSTQSLLVNEKNEKYDGFVLFEKLNITVCPYCNRNYVYNIPNDRRRTGELDHFYDKSTYPFFAMSFYNLIPACKVCNHIKSFNGKNLLNPYDSRIKLNECYRFLANIKGSNYLTDLNDLEINLLVDNKNMNNNFEIFNIEKLYGKHKDIVQELFKKRYFYSDEYIDQLFKEFHGSLFKNREELIGMLLSNYIQDEDLARRPLSKLTKDISEDIGFNY